MNTFEELDAHVTRSAAAVPAKDDITSPDFWHRLAKLHRTVGPIVRALASFPFIPATWRAMLIDLVNMMDLLTGNVAPIQEMLAAGKLAQSGARGGFAPSASLFPPGFAGPETLSRDA